MVIFKIDTQNVTVPTYDPIPAGKYLAIIEGEKHYRAKGNPNNIIIDFQIRIIDGDYKNRVLFYKNHACNTSQKASEIGVQQLQHISACVGHKGGFVLDTDAVDNPTPWFGVFFNTPIKIDVRLEDSPTYGVRNVVKNFFPATTNQTPVMQSQPVVTVTAPVATATAPVTTALKQEDFENLWGNRS